MCAIHWINFEMFTDSISCSIGRIRNHWWHNIAAHEDIYLKDKEFVSFNDLQPSRYVMSYVHEPNHHAFSINVAFIALDKEKLGDHVEDREHVDFGDNKFPLYMANRKNKLYYEDEEDCDIEVDSGSFLSDEQIESLSKNVPKSILSFLTINDLK